MERVMYGGTCFQLQLIMLTRETSTDIVLTDLQALNLNLTVSAYVDGLSTMLTTCPSNTRASYCD